VVGLAAWPSLRCEYSLVMALVSFLVGLLALQVVSSSSGLWGRSTGWRRVARRKMLESNHPRSENRAGDAGMGAVKVEWGGKSFGVLPEGLRSCRDEMQGGMDQFMAGDLEGSLVRFNNAQRFNSSQPMIQRAVTLYCAGNYLAAEELFRADVAKVKNMGISKAMDLRLWRAASLYKLGRGEEAPGVLDAHSTDPRKLKEYRAVFKRCLSCLRTQRRDSSRPSWTSWAHAARGTSAAAFSTEISLSHCTWTPWATEIWLPCSSPYHATVRMICGSICPASSVARSGKLVTRTRARRALLLLLYGQLRRRRSKMLHKWKMESSTEWEWEKTTDRGPQMLKYEGSIMCTSRFVF